jgi:hypothetical protein
MRQSLGLITRTRCFNKNTWEIPGVWQGTLGNPRSMAGHTGKSQEYGRAHWEIPEVWQGTLGNLRSMSGHTGKSQEYGRARLKIPGAWQGTLEIPGVWQGTLGNAPEGYWRPFEQQLKGFDNSGKAQRVFWRP